VELLAEMQKTTQKELRRTDEQLRRLGNHIHTVAQWCSIMKAGYAG
jgi:hypothetical protein